jgi:hypothetical protein
MFCKILKLSSGETIISDISEETKTYVDVFRPIRLMHMNRGEKTVQVYFAKWDPSVDLTKPIRIFKSAIVSVAEPDEDFLESYTEIYNNYDDDENVKVKSEDSSDKELETVEDINGSLDELMRLMLEASSKSKQTLH